MIEDSPRAGSILAPSGGTLPAPSCDDPMAARLRGFGPPGVLAIFIILAVHIVSVPLAALVVLIWVHLSRTAWRDIGFVRPRIWMASIARGVAFGVALKFLMKAVVMPLLGAEPVNHAWHYLAGNPSQIPWFLLTIAGAGFGEETLFRGYAFERLGKLLGSGFGARALIVVITSVWFGLAHYANLGFSGVEHAALVGLFFGAIFAVTGRIFMLMIAHLAFDLTAYALIYWNLESKIAHLVF
jgi:uncharacterized protein